MDKQGSPKLFSVATKPKDESAVLRVKIVALESGIITLELAASAGYTATPTDAPSRSGEPVSHEVNIVLHPNKPQQGPSQTGMIMSGQALQAPPTDREIQDMTQMLYNRMPEAQRNTLRTAWLKNLDEEQRLYVDLNNSAGVDPLLAHFLPVKAREALLKQQAMQQCQQRAGVDTQIVGENNGNGGKSDRPSTPQGSHCPDPTPAMVHSAPPQMEMESATGGVGTMMQPDMPQQAHPQTGLPHTKEQKTFFSPATRATIHRQNQMKKVAQASPEIQAHPWENLLRGRQPKQVAHLLPEKYAPGRQIVMQNRRMETARRAQMGPQQPQAPGQPSQGLRTGEGSGSMLGVEVIVLD